MLISVCSAQKHHELQFDDSKCHPAQKPEAPLWLVLHFYLSESTGVTTPSFGPNDSWFPQICFFLQVNSDQSEGVLLHEREKAKNNSAQGTPTDPERAMTAEVHYTKYLFLLPIC
jgi:hypothetical protein